MNYIWNVTVKGISENHWSNYTLGPRIVRIGYVIVN